MLVQVCGHWLYSHGDSALNRVLAERWIKSRRDEGFSITAVAGGAWGASLVVMSKGTLYTDQTYMVHMHSTSVDSAQGHKHIVEFISLVLHKRYRMSRLPLTRRCQSHSQSSGSARSGRMAGTSHLWPTSRRAGPSSCPRTLAWWTSTSSWTSSTPLRGTSNGPLEV